MSVFAAALHRPYLGMRTTLQQRLGLQGNSLPQRVYELDQIRAEVAKWTPGGVAFSAFPATF